MGAGAARDYVYVRREELRADLASGPGPRRERAREERDFLDREFERKLGGARGTVRVDPEFARAVREWTRRGSSGPTREQVRTVFPLKAKEGQGAEDRVPAEGGPSPATSAGRPTYWVACDEMDFNGLRGFIDESLRTPPGPDAAKLPRRRQEFVDLLKLLAEKGGIELDGDLRPVAGPDEDGPELRKARAYRDVLSRELAAAQRDLSSRKGKKARKAPERVRKLRQELARVRSRIARLEAEGKGASGKPRTERQRLRRLKDTRAERVVRVRRDIERVFAEGGPGVGPAPDVRGRSGGAGKLPWRVLPPGELTLEKVLAHYRRLARERPDAHFVPERIEKAHSLDPHRWWEGSAGFRGYVVFEYAGTDRVLLECGMYGNAIYVLGPDWKNLSRLSKREVLAHPSSRRIPHRGEWFATLKAELGLA